MKQYSNVVCTFFHLKTEAFIEEVLKAVDVVSDYYIRLTSMLLPRDKLKTDFPMECCNRKQKQ